MEFSFDKQASSTPDAVDWALVDPVSFETDGLSAAAQPIRDVIKRKPLLGPQSDWRWLQRAPPREAPASRLHG